MATKQRLSPRDGPDYVVYGDIPPECVRGHYHPERIPDPHQGYRLYTNPLLTCDICGSTPQEPKMKNIDRQTDGTPIQEEDSQGADRSGF
jgi:hypothetical protein